MSDEKSHILSLPLQLVGKTDLNRILKEAIEVDDFLARSAVREGGSAVKLPHNSKLLEDMLKANDLNLLNEDQRNHLIRFLKEVDEEAPTLQISFSTEPSPLVLKRLMTWFRREIHPMLLVQVGLQPGIGTGCIVRTPHKNFDFSLKQQLLSQRDLLITMMEKKTTQPLVKQG